ncbi:MAG: DinB family protein [Terriglobales bacterium]
MSSARTALTPDFILGYRELILSTMAGESKTTRKIIGAVPEVAKDWRPDRLSRTARELAWHLAYEEVLLLNMVADMKIAMSEAPAGPATIAEILRYYDEKLPPALSRVRDMTAEQLLTPVPFFGLVTEPLFRYLILINNHSIHHRGQLSSYLRSMGGKVPSIYGPSADES